mmetsp:Transcript_10140/g.33811  ORF Transcript_10140/g.33811 Transcript_10140/m.33811 type:complete len:82 (+) Transcript_10140:2077-2322(+)
MGSFFSAPAGVAGVNEGEVEEKESGAGGSRGQLVCIYKDAQLAELYCQLSRTRAALLRYHASLPSFASNSIVITCPARCVV